jgi:hypothetical protein
MSSAFSFNFVCTFFAIGRSSFLMAKLHRHLYKLCPCQYCLQLILIMVSVPIPQPLALKIVMSLDSASFPHTRNEVMHVGTLIERLFCHRNYKFLYLLHLYKIYVQ